MNAHSHITLTSEDITCYVGRDKHENEYLIKYGWPGDIWFHVEGLSSAHVYFRLDCFASSTVNPLVRGLLGKIPMDDLPKESIEDMCQIVKHNSIKGCKMASCKIVYTPHSNLKKTFDMDSGTVTYHDLKLQRHQRCDKDRKLIKELESTKSTDTTIDYYEEMKGNERRIIDLKKKLKKHGNSSGIDIYDPVLHDLRGQKSKSNQMGDNKSGLDSGLAALEGLALGSGGGRNTSAMGIHHNTNSNDNSDDDDDDEEDMSHLPIWERQANKRLERQPLEIVRFLMARGYTPKEIKEIIANDEGEGDASVPFSVTLSKLWSRQAEPRETVEEDLSAMMYEARNEEKEVLEAIYGEDDHIKFGWKRDDDEEDNQDDEDESDNEDESDDEDDPSKPFSFDSVIPVPGYEPPPRYEYPPPLLLEIYVDHGISNYPFGRTIDDHDENIVEPPVLAVVGGGLPFEHLRSLTKNLRERALERSSASEAGEPQIFDLLQITSELAEEVVAQETKAIEEARRIQIAKQTKEARLVAKEEAERTGLVDATTTKLTFKTEADRRAYAQSIVGRSFRGF